MTGWFETSQYCPHDGLAREGRVCLRCGFNFAEAPRIPFAAIWRGLVVLSAAFWVWLCFTTDPNVAVDGWGYYTASAESLYDHPPGATGAFLYSPVIFWAMEPLRVLDFPGFTNALRVLELGALFWLAGPVLPLTVIAFLPMELELRGPNVHLLMAAAIALGFRFPGTWAFVLLTKITPGLGLLWFAVRREWRALSIALATTVVIVAVSFALTPSLWFEWFALLTSTERAVDARWAVPLPPLWFRLPLAALLVAWGARRNLRWTMYVAAFLALPVPWIAGLVMLIPVLRDAVTTPMLHAFRRSPRQPSRTERRRSAPCSR